MYRMTEFDRDNDISSIVETLGDSNVTQIFVHSVTSLKNIGEYIKIKPELAKYSERALVLARPDDLVCVPDDVDNQHLQFLSGLAVGTKKEKVIVASGGVNTGVGASLSDLVAANPDALLTIRRLINPNKKIILNPYITTHREVSLASILEKVLATKIHLDGGAPEAVSYADQKCKVRNKALALGIPVPQGEVIEIMRGEDGRPLSMTPIESGVGRHIHRTGRVVIKGTHGTSGDSTFIIEKGALSIKKALNEIAEKDYNTTYIVESMIDFTVSPNVLMYIEPGKGDIFCVGITDQVLNENLMHEGNIYPSVANTLKDMVLSARTLSRWLQAKGYSGLLGFDFIEYFDREKGLYQHYLAEINPRTNAATYPRALMEHLNKEQKRKGRPIIRAFLSLNVRTKAISFADIEKLYGHSFFDPETGKGLVPFNIGCLEYGKFTAALFGKTRNEVLNIYKDLSILSQKEEEQLK
jgi:hypothetical protein